MTRRTRLSLFLTASVAAGLLVSSVACTSTIPRQNPVGSTFPSIQARDLAGEERSFPGEFAGAPALVILGYIQKTQFDVDRWLLGLTQADRGLPVVEMPAARGLVPRIISGTIDGGMRSGIPEEDWRSVVTVYKQSDQLANWTGTEDPRNARVLLLDAEGKVIWFHDRGYSAGKLLEMFTAAGL